MAVRQGHPVAPQVVPTLDEAVGQVAIAAALGRQNTTDPSADNGNLGRLSKGCSLAGHALECGCHGGRLGPRDSFLPLFSSSKNYFLWLATALRVLEVEEGRFQGRTPL